jgi:hypothetical protein
MFERKVYSSRKAAAFGNKSVNYGTNRPRPSTLANQTDKFLFQTQSCQTSIELNSEPDEAASHKKINDFNASVITKTACTKLRKTKTSDLRSGFKPRSAKDSLTGDRKIHQVLLPSSVGGGGGGRKYTREVFLLLTQRTRDSNSA